MSMPMYFHWSTRPAPVLFEFVHPTSDAAYFAVCGAIVALGLLTEFVRAKRAAADAFFKRKQEKTLQRHQNREINDDSSQTLLAPSQTASAALKYQYKAIDTLFHCVHLLFSYFLMLIGTKKNEIKLFKKKN